MKVREHGSGNPTPTDRNVPYSLHIPAEHKKETGRAQNPCTNPAILREEYHLFLFNLPGAFAQAKTIRAERIAEQERTTRTNAVRDRPAPYHNYSFFIIHYSFFIV